VCENLGAKFKSDANIKNTTWSAAMLEHAKSNSDIALLFRLHLLIVDATIADFGFSLRIHRAQPVDFPRHFRYDAFDGALIVRFRHAPHNAESAARPSSTSTNFPNAHNQVSSHWTNSWGALPRLARILLVPLVGHGTCFDPDTNGSLPPAYAV
jgi:hypothetical protein